MHRFFVSREQINENEITLLGEDVKHVRNVLRLSVGDKLMLCDSAGHDYEAEITEISSEFVRTKVLFMKSSLAEPGVSVVLYQGLPKAGKMETIVQKAVEIGAVEIVPVKTARSVVKIEDDRKEAKKLERWNRVSYEAAKQSGRGIVPPMAPMMSFRDAVLRAGDEADLVLMPYELETTCPLSEVLKHHSGAKRIAVFIGPEGGFSDSEAELMTKEGGILVTLGRRILRTETAGASVLSVLMYQYGEWAY